jgi:signal transduction histidine kinase
MSRVRFGLQPRVFVAVLTVALASSFITGVIVRNRTLAAAQKASSLDVVKVGDIFAALDRYPFENGSWGNVADLVNRLAEDNDVRIVLTDEKRNVFAEADSRPGAAIPQRPQAVFFAPDTRKPDDEIEFPAAPCMKVAAGAELALPERFETYSGLVEAIDNPNAEGDEFDQALSQVSADNRYFLKTCLSDSFRRDGPQTYEYLGVGDQSRLPITGLSPLTWLTLFGGALGFAVAAAALVARRIARPVRALTNATVNLAQGTLNHRLTVTGSDEVAVLGKAFNDMSAKLENVERQRSQLVRDLAHELRNPLGVLQGSLEGAIDGVLPLNEDSLATMHGEVRHLAALVDDLQQLSAFDSGGITFTAAPMKLRELIVHVVEGHRVANRELAFNVVSEDIEITADRVRLRQVMANLVRNATQHTEPPGRITVTAKQIANQVIIAVADSGSGMTAEQLTHVFDRFWRADESRRRDEAVRGSGLGLSICKAIVESHGGSIRVESTVGVGTTFYVALPVASETR